MNEEIRISYIKAVNKLLVENGWDKIPKSQIRNRTLEFNQEKLATIGVLYWAKRTLQNKCEKTESW